MSNNVGKWAIVSVMSPVGVGQIVGDYDKYYEVKLPWGSEPWVKQYCQVFDTEEQARKEYEDYTTNPNNYAYEG